MAGVMKLKFKRLYILAGATKFNKVVANRKPLTLSEQCPNNFLVVIKRPIIR